MMPTCPGCGRTVNLHYAGCCDYCLVPTGDNVARFKDTAGNTYDNIPLGHETHPDDHGWGHFTADNPRPMMVCTFDEAARVKAQHEADRRKRIVKVLRNAAAQVEAKGETDEDILDIAKELGQYDDGGY